MAFVQHFVDKCEFHGVPAEVRFFDPFRGTFDASIVTFDRDVRSFHDHQTVHRPVVVQQVDRGFQARNRDRYAPVFEDLQQVRLLDDAIPAAFSHMLPQHNEDPGCFSHRTPRGTSS